MVGGVDACHIIPVDSTILSLKDSATPLPAKKVRRI
jgi:hypothetical protein